MNTDDRNFDFDEKDRRFLKRHWRMMVVFGALVAAAASAAVYVLLWFVATAQATGFVPIALGDWTVGYVVAFVLHLIFWELLLVGSWAAVAAVLLAVPWYRKLPDEDKRGSSKRRTREGGDAFGFLVLLTWLLVVWFDGRWALPFQTWTVNAWVYSFLAAVAWDLLIFGIPILIAFIWWIRKGVSENEVRQEV